MARVLGKWEILVAFICVAALLVFIVPRPNAPARTAAATSSTRSVTTLSDAHARCRAEFVNGQRVSLDAGTNEYVCYDSIGNELGRLPRR